MNIRKYLYLCMMAYADLPPLYSGLISRGGRIPVAAFADYILRMDAAGMLKCIQLTGSRRAAAETLLSSDGVITAYINDNAGSGFVGYVVEFPEETVVVMRGSESPGECADSYVDWVDNLCEPFAGSVQNAAIDEIVKDITQGSVVFTGHSKGGHNALIALAASDNPDARAVAFNGQGFASGTLDEKARLKLFERGVNYVTADDVVGALLEHPERRIFVKQTPGANAHMPEAYTFDEAGAPVRGLRTTRSYAAEAASRFADSRFGSAARNGITQICRRSLSIR